MFGLVTVTKPLEKGFMLSIIGDDCRFAVISKERFRPGSWVEFSGQKCKIDEDTTEVKVVKIKEIGEDKAKAQRKKVESYINKECKIRKTKFMINDAITKKLASKFEKAALMIKRAVFMHRPIIIRHDNDTDGLCSAIALYNSLSDTYHLKVIQEQFPYYKGIEAENDLRHINSLEADHLPPLLICLDFGSNIESIPTYKKVKEQGFLTIIVDHHPIRDKELTNVVELVVSPHTIVSDTSATDYSTGFLAAEIAKKVKDVDVEMISRVGMVSDRSPLIKATAREEKYARALEFINTTSRYLKSIDSFARVFNDEETIDFAYAQAEERMQFLIESMSKAKKKTNKGVTFFLLDVNKLVRRGRYPRRKVIANTALDVLAQPLNTPAVTIIYGGRNISFRLNKVAVDKGLSASAAIYEIKKAYPNAVVAGGGHAVASAMRVKLGFAKKIIEYCMDEIVNQQHEK